MVMCSTCLCIQNVTFTFNINFFFFFKEHIYEEMFDVLLVTKLLFIFIFFLNPAHLTLDYV